MRRSFLWGCAQAFIRTQTAYLNALPYVLAQCRDREITRKARADDHAAPEERRRKVCFDFFHSEGAVREHVDRYLDGESLAFELDDALKRVELAPLTEERSEAPHAVMERERKRAARAQRVWKAASLRLPQNLLMFTKLSEHELHLFEREWAVARRAVQIDARKKFKVPGRMKFTRAKTLFYRSDTSVPLFPSGVDASSP